MTKSSPKYKRGTYSKSRAKRIMRKFYSIQHKDIPGKDPSYNAKELAQTFRLVKTLIKTHFEISVNRYKSIKTLERLIENFDRQLKEQGLKTTSNKEHRTKLSDDILENDSVNWVFSELEENLLLQELDDYTPSEPGPSEPITGLQELNPLCLQNLDFLLEDFSPKTHYD